jgi:DNA-binding NarL/FixJ family response regulator
MCLSALPGLEIVGAVPDGRSALEDFETCQPNLVLLDINMPGMDGFETAQALLAAHPGLWIIGVSADVQPNFQQRAQQAGLKTIIAKDMLLDYLPPMDLKPLAV